MSADTTRGPVVAMIFEFWFDPEAPDIFDEYLSESEEVRRRLADYEGFLGVERFQSTVNPSKFVAVGFFEDEAAVKRWRTAPEHRRVQSLGRNRGDVGVAHFLVADQQAAVAVLESPGLHVAACREVLSLRLDQEEPGQLGKLTVAMAEAGVDIEVLYSDHDHRLILLVDEMDAGRRVGDQWMAQQRTRRHA